jgi:hypothetical protein
VGQLDRHPASCGSGGARDWASYVEPQYQLLYETVHDGPKAACVVMIHRISQELPRTRRQTDFLIAGGRFLGIWVLGSPALCRVARCRDGVGDQFGARADPNQLHIHIVCVLPAVAESLAGNAAEITDYPAKTTNLPLGPARHIYRVITATGQSGADSPFGLVAAMPGASAAMRDHSITFVGTTIPGTFISVRARLSSHLEMCPLRSVSPDW